MVFVCDNYEVVGRRHSSTRSRWNHEHHEPWNKKRKAFQRDEGGGVERGYQEMEEEEEERIPSALPLPPRLKRTSEMFNLPAFTAG